MQNDSYGSAVKTPTHLVKGESSTKKVEAKATLYKGKAAAHNVINGTPIGQIAAVTVDRSCLLEKGDVPITGQFITIPEIGNISHDGKGIESPVTFDENQTPVATMIQTTETGGNQKTFDEAPFLVEVDEPELLTWKGFQRILDPVRSLFGRMVADRGNNGKSVISAAFATRGVEVQYDPKADRKGAFNIVLATTAIWASLGSALGKFWARLDIPQLTLSLLNNVLVPARTAVRLYKSSQYGEGLLVFQGMTVSYIQMDDFRRLFKSLWSGLRNTLGTLDNVTNVSMNIQSHLSYLGKLQDKDGRPVIALQVSPKLYADGTEVFQILAVDANNTVRPAYIEVAALLNGDTTVQFINENESFDGEFLIADDNGVCAIQAYAPTVSVSPTGTVTRRLQFSQRCAPSTVRSRSTGAKARSGN